MTDGEFYAEPYKKGGPHSDELRTRIFEMYREGKSIAQIHRETKVAAESISRWLKAEGITIVRPTLWNDSGLTDEQRAEISQRYEKGGKAPALAKEYGVSPRTVRRIFEGWAEKNLAPVPTIPTRTVKKIVSKVDATRIIFGDPVIKFERDEYEPEPFHRDLARKTLGKQFPFTTLEGEEVAKFLEARRVGLKLYNDLPEVKRFAPIEKAYRDLMSPEARQAFRELIVAHYGRRSA